jgi:4-amino-4-deoxy-L-arabinose transferase-like glycosyltransferase
MLFFMICIILLDLVVIAQRPMVLTEGGSSTWWMITKSVEDGRGYKSCEEAYVPNCRITDQTTAIREPFPVLLYALVGKITGDLPVAFQLTQLVFNLLICWFIFLLTTEIGSRLLGLAASFIWAFFLPTLRVEAHINGDLIAGLFVVMGVLYFTRAVKGGSLKHWMLSGFLFGLAILSRSSTLLVVFALFGGIVVYFFVLRQLFSSNRWQGLLAAAFVLGVTVSPWVIRNIIVFDKPILGTTLVGYNLYRHNAIVVSEVFPHYVGSEEGIQEIRTLIARVPELHTPINEAQVDAIFQREALKLISANREEYVELVLFRFIPLWFNIGVLEQYDQQMMLLDYFVVLQQAILLFVFLIALWKGDWFMRILAFSVPVFMFGYLAIDSQLRYMIPVMPLVISIGIVGLYRLFSPRVRNI